jgi:hypothetical protein
VRKLLPRHRHAQALVGADQVVRVLGGRVDVELHPAHRAGELAPSLGISSILLTCHPRVALCVFSRCCGRGLNAHQFEPQTADTVEDAVKLGLVHNLSRQDGLPCFRLHLHPFEGRCIPFTEFTTHHYPVGLPGVLAAPLFADAIQCSLSVRHSNVLCPHPPAHLT